MTAPAGSTVPEALVAVVIAGQRIGLPLAAVRDVIGPRPMTPVPAAPPEVAGVLNLRGRIVTAIDLAIRFDVANGGDSRRSVVVEQDGALYGIIVDAVGEVTSPTGRRSWRSRIDRRWRLMANGSYALDDGPLLVLDVERMLEAIGHAGADRRGGGNPA